MRYIVEIIFFLLIFGITEYHAQRFKDNKTTGPLFHIFWAALYFIPAGYVSFVMFQGWWLPVALCLERFVLYNFLLNLIRYKPFFYLSIQSKNSSWWDKIEIGWGKAYPYVWIVSAAALAALQFMK